MDNLTAIGGIVRNNTIIKGDIGTVRSDKVSRCGGIAIYRTGVKDHMAFENIHGPFEITFKDGVLNRKLAAILNKHSSRIPIFYDKAVEQGRRIDPDGGDSRIPILTVLQDRGVIDPVPFRIRGSA
jgi:hypothetical protein